MTELRKLQDGKTVDVRDALVALILIDWENREVEYAKNVVAKRQLLAHYMMGGEGVRLLVAWPGQWSQDIFETSQESVLDFQEELGV